MADKVYYRGEGDENTFHDAVTRQLRMGEDAASRDFSEASEQTEGDFNANLDNRREAESSPNAVNAGLRGQKNNQRNDKGEDSESSTGGFWRGQGGQEAKGEGKKKGKKKRRLGPVLLILMGIFGVGGLSFMGTMMGPFAFLSNAMDQFNVMRVSMNRRSTYFTRFQMDESLNKSLTNRRFGIFSSEKFQISNRMKKKLAMQGIDYEVDEETGARYLHFTASDGEESVIFANAKDGDALASSSTKRSGRLISMDDMLDQDTEFFTGVQSATKTVKGHIVGWFESLTESFMNRIKNTRNRFFGLDDDADDEEVKNKAKATGLTEEAGDSEGNPKRVRVEQQEVPDPDNPGHTKIIEVEVPEEIEGSDALYTGASTTAVHSALKVKAEKAAAAVGTASVVQGVACGLVNAVGAINMAVTAIQVAKVINFATGLFEAIQRTQMGEGGSELATYFNAFAQPTDNEVWHGDEDNMSKDVTSHTSTMASIPYNTFFGGQQVSKDDEEAQKFNRDKLAGESIKKLAGTSAFSDFIATLANGATNLKVYQACLYSGIALNLIGTVVDAVLLFATFGIGNLIKGLFKGIAKKLIQAGIMAVVGIVIAALVPKIAQLLATDLIGKLGGTNSAHAIKSGANIVQGKAMESNSGAVGNKAAVMAMYRENQEILAQDARYERAIKSPLDPTSKYTFVGSMMYSLMPIANVVAGSGGALSAVGSALTTVGKSALSLFPSASAAAEENWYEIDLYDSTDDCPNLSAFGIAGDVYCNPYYTSDFSTIDMDPYEVVENVGLDNFENDEVDNPGIKMDSELGKYIVACTLRDAQYGIKDAMVQSWIENPTGNTTLNAIVDSGTGIIPIVGNLFDAAQSISEANNLKWNSGQACVQDSSVNPDWNQNKYYQRYIEDQTLMEASGIIEESAVTAFVNKYYELNPIDNSLEGVIARYSGMSKEEASNVVALIEYIDFIANYDATDRYPLPVEEKEPAETALRDILLEAAAEDPMTDITPDFYEPVSTRRVVYFDLRSRVYTV